MKHEDYDDRTVRSSFAIVERRFEKETCMNRNFLAEVTDVRDGIVEIKVAPNKYLLLDQAQMMTAITNHLEDYSDA